MSFSVLMASSDTSEHTPTTAGSIHGTNDDIITPSFPLEFRETAPDPPDIPHIINIGITDATVSWNNPDNNGGCPITGYLLEYREMGTGRWYHAQDFITGLTATVCNLKARTAYEFRVSARNAIGKGRPSKLSDECCTKNPIVPDAPEELRISRTDITSVTLDWEPPKFDGGSQITGYVVEHRRRNSSEWMQYQQTPATSCTVHGLNWMETFEFRVIAENELRRSVPNELPGKYRSAYGKWTMTNQICHRSGPGKFDLGDGITYCPNTDIAVADYKAAKVKILNKHGKFRLNLDTTKGLKSWQQSRPRQVKVSFNGEFFVTDSTHHVKVYDKDGSFERQFPALSPDNVPSDSHTRTKLCGLDLNEKGELFVGVITDNETKYISRHAQNGRHLGSISINIEPHYLAVSSENTIVVSSENPSCVVEIIDANGTLLRRLIPPADTIDWVPRGVRCCRDIILVINSAIRGSSGIYCYSIIGDFLCCIVQDLPFAFDLAVSEDGNQILVTKNSELLVFERGCA